MREYIFNFCFIFCGAYILMYICVRILFVVLIMYIICSLIIIDYQRFIKNIVFSANFFYIIILCFRKCFSTFAIENMINQHYKQLL